MTYELRVVKSFLETLKVETVGKLEAGCFALRFSNMKPGYRNSVTVSCELLPLEMSLVIRRMLVKAQGTEKSPDAPESNHISPV